MVGSVQCWHSISVMPGVYLPLYVMAFYQRYARRIPALVCHGILLALWLAAAPSVNLIVSISLVVVFVVSVNIGILINAGTRLALVLASALAPASALTPASVLTLALTRRLGGLL